jgi:small subunit ribosomal protein S9
VPEVPEAPEVPVSAAPPEPAPTPAEKKPKSNVPFTWGTGRRKAAVARVRIRPGTGEFLINKRKVEDFFCIDRDRAAALKPLEVTDTRKDYDVYVNIAGGGITGQSGAVMLGLARALVKANGEYEAKLREFQLLRRDPRRVERKKYGQRGARRRFQFSKR